MEVPALLGNYDRQTDQRTDLMEVVNYFSPGAYGAVFSREKSGGRVRRGEERMAQT